MAFDKTEQAERESVIHIIALYMKHTDFSQATDKLFAEKCTIYEMLSGAAGVHALIENNLSEF